MACAHVFISGRVQGVFFREHTRRKAEKLDIKGWVRNLPDGRVESVLEGPDEKLQEMIAWYHQGSPKSRVDNVKVKRQTAEEHFFDFKIIS